MNRGQLVTRLELYKNKVKKANQTTLQSLVQEGADDICNRLILLPTSKKITVTAEERYYTIHEYIDDFLVMDDTVLQWYNGTGWTDLLPLTFKQLDDEYRNWRNGSSADPMRYAIRNSYEIILDPIPDTTLAEGLWVYYGKRPDRMSTNSDYPFSGSTTEIPQFVHLQELIIEYAEWKLLKALDKEKSLEQEKLYKLHIEEARLLLDRRPDLTSDEDYKMRTRKVCNVR